MESFRLVNGWSREQNCCSPATQTMSWSDAIAIIVVSDSYLCLFQFFWHDKHLSNWPCQGVGRALSCELWEYGLGDAVGLRGIPGRKVHQNHYSSYYYWQFQLSRQWIQYVANIWRHQEMLGKICHWQNQTSLVGPTRPMTLKFLMGETWSLFTSQ